MKPPSALKTNVLPTSHTWRRISCSFGDRRRCLRTRSGRDGVFSLNGTGAKELDHVEGEALVNDRSSKATVEAETAHKDHPQSFLQQKARAIRQQCTAAASTSSMTMAEKAAFDEVRKLFDNRKPSTTLDNPGATSQTDTDYKNLLHLFQNKSEISSSQDDDFTKGRTQVTSLSQQGNLIDGVALSVMGDIAASFDKVLMDNTAQADHAIWDVCERKVFPLFKLLVPSKPSSLTSSTNANPVPQQSGQHFSSQAYPMIPQNLPLIPLLSQVYPASTLLALRLFQRHHPTSPYCLNFLPHIKSLGPTSYVLGANTHFYNTLLSIMWDVYSDLEGIIKLLAEMDRMGLEYDVGTTGVLRRIDTERNLDMRLMLSNHSSIDASSKPPPHRRRGGTWWSRPLINRSWNRLQEWRSIITHRLEEKGLGEVTREGSITYQFTSGQERNDSDNSEKNEYVVML